MGKLRVVSWNCRYGFFEDKLRAVEKLDADILVIQECGKTDWEGYLKSKYGPSSDWFSDGKDAAGSEERDLGVFVFCKGGPKPERLYTNAKFRYVLPYKIGGKIDLTLFAVWTKEKDNYLGPVLEALKDKDYCDKISGDKPAIVIGDFNTGSVKGSDSEHEYTGLKNKFLEKKLYNCAGDQEWTPTFFRDNGSWLDDHCFANESLCSKLISFGIGSRDYWSKFSDHSPIFVDFDL
jgi:endonuclease/exonuclease/phosphatase family metal-dependent hydrolase